jgi:hypothetical protein
MAMTAETLLAHPGLRASLRQQASLLAQAYDANPRVGTVFATQQRWLMAHIGLALAFRAGTPGRPGSVSNSQFFDVVALHDVASRNTADAFIKEMEKYGYVRAVADPSDRRRRPFEPTELSVAEIHGWVAIHLSTLDRLDDGRRLATYLDRPERLGVIHPLISDGLLSSHGVRAPERAFSLFTWLDKGGLVMERLVAGLEETPGDTERIPTGMVSVAAMAEWLRLSRTHLARKLHEAEAMGSIGWQGRRGHSVMWVSRGFLEEYALAQAAKLTVVDAAFEACFADAAGQAAPMATDAPSNSWRSGVTAN